MYNSSAWDRKPLRAYFPFSGEQKEKDNDEISFGLPEALCVHSARKEVQVQVVDGDIKKQSGHRERLKSRFLANADGSHSDEALLELLLTYALPQKDVRPLANHLLTTFGSLQGVLSADLPTLTQQDGVKEHTAILLKAIDWIRVNLSHTRPATPARSDALLPSQSDRQEASSQAEASPVETVRDERPAMLAMPSLFSDLVQVVDNSSASQKRTHLKNGSSLPARLALFGNADLKETIDILPRLPVTTSSDEVRAFLKQHLPFSGQTTRERRAQYIAKRMFPDGHVDAGLLLFARMYAGRQELREACLYRFCKAEPLMYEVIEQVMLPAVGAGSIRRSLLRDYLEQRFPGSASIQHCMNAIVSALLAAGVATADRETIRFAYREPSLAAFAFVVHSEFAGPGMFAIEKVEQNRALRALLWQPASFLSSLYELRNRKLIGKISEIDSLRQFTTIYTLDQLCERLAAAGESV